MLSTSEDTVRDARIYRVNAWREIKGRPALDFSPKVEAWLVFPEADPFRSQADETEPETLDAPEKLTQAKGTRPPEWWTEENTAAWTREVWGGERAASDAQRTWGRKYQTGDKIARGKFPPPTKADYKRWAHTSPLAVKVKRTRKVATVWAPRG
jgi:hypothetical protein